MLSTLNVPGVEVRVLAPVINPAPVVEVLTGVTLPGVTVAVPVSLPTTGVVDEGTGFVPVFVDMVS